MQVHFSPRSPLFSLVAKNNDELVHLSLSFLFCFCALKEDDDELVLVIVLLFCFFAPKEDDDQLALVIIFFCFVSMHTKKMMMS